MKERNPESSIARPPSAPFDIDAAEKCVVRALERLLRYDAHLLECDANERSITHKLAEHLQRELPEWDVDCEYNRDGHEPKRLHLPVRNDVSSDDTKARTVFPDVIVHRRNSNENYIAIEAKKANNADGTAFDIEKLTKFQQELKYKVAAFVLFGSIRADATFLGDQSKKVSVLHGQEPTWEYLHHASTGAQR